MFIKGPALFANTDSVGFSVQHIEAIYRDDRGYVNMSQILSHINTFTAQVCPEIVFDYEKNYRTMYFPTTVKNRYIYLMPKNE